MISFIFICFAISNSFDLDMNLIDQIQGQKSIENFLTPKSSLDGLSMGGENVEVNDSFLWLMRIARENDRRNKNQTYSLYEIFAMIEKSFNKNQNLKIQRFL